MEGGTDMAARDAAEVARRICVVALWLASQPLDDATALDMALSYVEGADADPFPEGEL